MRFAARLWVRLAARCVDSAALAGARRGPGVDRVTNCGYGTCTVYLVLRCCWWQSVTRPNRWLNSGEYRRSLPVVPLIGNQRYYGEAPVRLRRGYQRIPRTGE